MTIDPSLMMSMPNRAPYFLGVYWGPRKDSLAQAAERLAVCLTAWSKISPHLRDWYYIDDHLKRQRLEIEPSSLEAPIREAYQDTGSDHPRPRDGQSGSVGIATSSELLPVSVGILCGFTSKAFPNSCIMSLPAVDPVWDLLQEETASALLCSAAEAWDAAHGMVSHQSWLPPRRPGQSGRPRVGWLTYMSKELLPPPKKRPDAIWRPCDNGELVSLGPDVKAVDGEMVAGLARELQKYWA